MIAAMILAAGLGEAPPVRLADLDLVCSVIDAAGVRTTFGLKASGQASARRYEISAPAGSPWAGFEAASWKMASVANREAPPATNERFAARVAQGTYQVTLERHPGDSRDIAIVRIDQEPRNSPFTEVAAQGACSGPSPQSPLQLAAVPAITRTREERIKLDYHDIDANIRAACKLVTPAMDELAFEMEVRLPPGSSFTARLIPPRDHWPNREISGNGMSMHVFSVTETTPERRYYEIYNAMEFEVSGRGYSMVFELLGEQPRGWMKLSSYMPGHRDRAEPFAAGPCLAMRPGAQQ